jgi:hypothetical protein
MTFLGQRQQQFKFVDQKAASRFTLRQRIPRSLPATGKKPPQKPTSWLKLKHGHSVFKSPDLIFLLIGFPYCSMRQLY